MEGSSNFTNSKNSIFFTENQKSMMEMEDKESTESGSLGVNSEYDSPPPEQPLAVVPVVAGGAEAGANGSFSSGVGGVVGTQVMDISLGGTGGGGVVGSGGNGVVVGSGDKKKRGRPRKYDADGNLTPQYIKAAAAAAAKAAAAAAVGSGGGVVVGGAVTSPGGGGVTSPPTGFTITSPVLSSGGFSSSKRGRGRPTGAGNLQLIASLGELFAHTAGGDFMPHVVTVHTGEDVAGKVYSFVQKGSRGICVLSANGAVSNVTIRQPGSSGGLLTYEMVVGSFMPNAFKTQNKRKHHQIESRMPPVIHSSPDPVSMIRPVSQAPPSSNITLTQTSQVPSHNHGEADNSTSNKDMPNSTSTDTSDCNGSEPAFEQRSYPDINVSIPME
ncbi:AT-hook motif nuclear-localized protein 7-like isoform X2 [Solanum pennellii]|uniref:AT-hook motif nuclear-localized protein n=1 Tax=Solanum pennellii TaxID=28526 RepID=A0ABM1HJ06_SOLPN|nr:AT-hook motif nuclear-localized protein 7-like isoform X2 [Solanum pennellii]